MKLLLAGVFALVLSGCANISGPCYADDTSVACKDGGSITVISPAAAGILRK